MSEFKLPDVGEGLTEAEIVSWKVKVGDIVEINDVIVEIETAKSLVELPSPYAGTVLALLVSEGETVDVGTPIISVGDPSPARRPPLRRPSPTPTSGWRRRPAPRTAAPPGRPGRHRPVQPAPPPASMEGASLVGRIKADRGPMRRARRGSASPSTDAGAADPVQLQGAFAPGGAQSQDVLPADESPVPAVDQRRAPAPPRPRRSSRRPRRSSPATYERWRSRRCASWPRTSASTWPTLTGSGPAGIDHPRRRRRCGRRAVRSGPRRAAAAVAAAPGERETREPIKGVRKMMAQAMGQSAFTARTSPSGSPST